MITLEAKENIEPRCPHCSTELRTIWMRELRCVLGKRYIYFSSNCRKVLGVTHRKGFWMG